MAGRKANAKSKRRPPQPTRAAPAKQRGKVAKKQIAKKQIAKKQIAKKQIAKKQIAKKQIAKKQIAKKQIAKKQIAKKQIAKGPRKATPARDARQALELKKTITRTLAPLPDGTAVVDAYLRDLDHPFKQEIEAVRAVICGASPKISERIKWNAPSFYYKEDLGAFNPRATEFAHLILLFPGGAGMADASGLLEGNHTNRREAKFHSLDDVKAKRPALEKLVRQWVALRDR
jgi:hypothetical protein